MVVLCAWARQEAKSVCGGCCIREGLPATALYLPRAITIPDFIITVAANTSQLFSFGT